MSMSIDEIQGLLESLSAELGSSLVLDDAEQHLIAHTGHDGSVDDVRRESILGRGAQPDVRRWFEQWGIRDAVTPIRTPADLTAGVRARWCIPVRHRGELLGFVSAFDKGQVNDEALDGAMKIAEQLAAVLFRRRLAERTDAELVRHVIHRTGPSDDPTDAYPRHGHIAVVVIGFDEAVDPDGPMLADLASATRRAADVFPRGTAPSGEIGGLVAALVPIHRASDTQPAKQLAETALRTASRCSSSPISAGISSGSCTASTAGTAYAEARRALRVARSVPQFSPIAAWNDIGAYRTLVMIPPTNSHDNVIDPRVHVLHRHVELARTAEEFLDRAGDAQATAEHLIIHRSTLYQRLSRIQQLCNLDLHHSGEDRLITHLGLRLLRLAPT
jgi:hypothetical protein